jgi:hypothetical protein
MKASDRRVSVLAFVCILLSINGSSGAAQTPPIFSGWPAGTSPTEVGKRLAQKFAVSPLDRFATAFHAAGWTTEERRIRETAVFPERGNRIPVTGEYNSLLRCPLKIGFSRQKSSNFREIDWPSAGIVGQIRKFPCKFPC